MGAIQNVINQGITTLGVAARLSPQYETKQGLHKLKKEEQALDIEQSLIPEVTPEEFEAGQTVDAKRTKEILERKADIAAERAKLKPTQETVSAARLAASGANRGSLAVIGADPDEIAEEQREIAQEQYEAKQQEAMQKVAAKQTAQQSQKDKFMNWVKNLEVAGGGKVKDLPPNMQAQILAAYSEESSKGGNK